MTGVWNPALWDDFGVVGLVVAMGALLFVSLTRGWIVIGRYHREILEAKDSRIAAADVRAAKDAETIGTLSQAVIDKNATENATTRILAAFRDAVGGGG